MVFLNVIVYLLRELENPQSDGSFSPEIRERLSFTSAFSEIVLFASFLDSFSVPHHGKIVAIMLIGIVIHFFILSSDLKIQFLH
jgi:hypothetical protein